jgi:uncharacterized HAD superfamily protein
VSKPIILVDLDGCVAELWQTVNKIRGWENLPYIPVPEDYQMSNLYETDRAHMEGLFANANFYKRQRPMQGAKPALWALQNFYRILYVTSRGVSDTGEVDKRIERITRQWIADWEMPHNPIIHTPIENKLIKVRMEYPGEEIAFAIEDNALAAENYMKAGIRVYLMRYPYNRQIPESALCYGINTLLQVVESLELPQAHPGEETLSHDNFGFDTGQGYDTGDENSPY